MTAGSVATLPRELRAPRVPRKSPVQVTYICTVNDPSGSPRRGWIVRDHDGRVVETLEEGYTGHPALDHRWPWYDHRQRARFGLDRSYYPVTLRVDVQPREWASLMALEPAEGCAKLRALGDKCERFSAVVEAASSIASAVGSQGPDWDRHDRSAVIYYRTPRYGGNHVDRAVRRAVSAMLRHGMAVQVWPTTGKLGDVHGQYRATPTTPRLP